MNVVYNKDCLEVMKALPDNSIDLICTDPPYGYSFMGKDWDTFNEVVKPGGSYEDEKGFKKLPRNKPNGMYEFFLPIWIEALRILKPGAFAFVMCAPRQDVLSKQICAITDAGFNTSFSSIYWTYASGFPKAHNIGKAIDKKNNIQRKVISRNSNSRENCDKSNTIYESGRTAGKTDYLTKGNGPLEGSYGGCQLKPAVEVILVCMKPLSEKTYVAQALNNGKGITWLDDCRIPYTSVKPKGHGAPAGGFAESDHFGGASNSDYEADNRGRFSANLLVSDDVLNDGTKLKSNNKSHDRKSQGLFAGGKSNVEFSDEGSYSKYFDLDRWTEINGIKKDTFPFIICPKAQPKEKKANTHPTIKPLKLMSYLITLGSRPNDVVLDPFAGSGTTLVAAKNLNRNYIGCELSKEYCDITNARLGETLKKEEQHSKDNQFFTF
jgi:DNA modification methylase